MSNQSIIAEPLPGMAPASARFVRQSDFVPYEVINKTPVAVIGCGAIGREVGRMLAAIGINEIVIVDFDTVTPTNVTTQGFKSTDVGKEKVHALEEAILEIDPNIKVHAVMDRYRPRMVLPEVVFMCVDSIVTRELIYKSLKKKGAKFVIDGRMLGEVMRVLTIELEDEESCKRYESSIFPESEQEPERCTAHATIYCASGAAMLMVHQFTRYMRNFPLDADMSLNLLAGDLFPVSN